MEMTELKTLDKEISHADNLYDSIRKILLKSRNQAYQAVNSAMVMAYWSIGRAIVEYEQQGMDRGEYGKQVLEILSW